MWERRVVSNNENWGQAERLSQAKESELDSMEKKEPKGVLKQESNTIGFVL